MGGETVHGSGLEPDGRPVKCSTHSFTITRLHARSGAGKRAHVCLRPVSVYVCMLLFTGWMQTYGPSSVASNSCGAVCETVIVSGKLSQETLCSSGLKAVGVGVGGAAWEVKVDVMFSAATWCVQRWSQRWNSGSESALFPCCCCCYWILERVQIHTDPRVGCMGQGPPGQDLSNGWRSGAVCCAVSHLPRADWLQLQDLRGFHPPPLKMDGYFLHVFSLVMDCFLTVLLLCIYLNVVPQLNTCSREEI